MGKRKGIKALNELVKQFDSVLPTLSGKPAADILVEKSSVLRQIIKIEREDEDAKTEKDATDAAEKIASLTQQLSDSQGQVTSLSSENVRLQKLADTPRIERIPDERHVATAEERDNLQNAMSYLAAILNELPVETRLEIVVRFAQSCSHSGIVKSFCQAARVGFDDLSRFLRCSEVDLIRWQDAPDTKPLVKMVRQIKFPKPVRSVEPEQPERPLTGEEKVEQAKRLVGNYRPAYVRSDEFASEKARTRSMY
jgi:hypothetical protein